MDSRKQPEAFVIDSFAWFEYFTGSSAGEKAKQYVESGGAMTPSIVVAELSEKYRREGLAFTEDLDFIIGKTRIISLDA